MGIVQAVQSRGSRAEPVSIKDLIELLHECMTAHPETRVWNISANVERECHPYEVSELGHALGQIARHFDVLLVISSGNSPPDEERRIAPPADCEASLVVAGRAHDIIGEVSGPCEVSRRAYGPDLMFKPDVSWYSRHRIIGGDTETGSSFAAPLIARTAAHCFANLVNPNADLVRALILNATDLPKRKYCEQLGYGSPIRIIEPWNCPPNMAILTWKESMFAQTAYNWEEIAIPPSMILEGRLVGRVRLVVVQNPTVQRLGDEYISNRVRANIRYRRQDNGKPVGILGTTKPDTYEQVARKDEQKWQGVQVFEKIFTSKNGPKIGGNILEANAQIFWRHKFLYDSDVLDERRHNVTFVLTLESLEPNADTYNEFRQMMTEQRVEEIVEQVDITVNT